MSKVLCEAQNPASHCADFKLLMFNNSKHSSKRRSPSTRNFRAARVTIIFTFRLLLLLRWESAELSRCLHFFLLLPFFLLQLGFGTRINLREIYNFLSLSLSLLLSLSLSLRKIYIVRIPDSFADFLLSVFFSSFRTRKNKSRISNISNETPTCQELCPISFWFG